MRALSVSTLIVFLFMLAAHLSWWKTSSAISSKIINKGHPIFSGPNLAQIEKLDRLSELQKRPTKTIPKKHEEDSALNGKELADQLLSPDTNLTELRDLTSQDAHLLKELARQFSQSQKFDATTVRNIILTKRLSNSGPEAKALLRTLDRLQEDPLMRKENYTEVFFKIYEELALDPDTYENHYEMRDALSRMNFEPHEIDEFEQGLYEEQTQKY